MSIDLQANTSVASRGSGLGTTSGNGTAVVWHRKSSSAAAGDVILELGMSGSTLRFSVGASDAVDYETGGGAQTPDNAATHADGTWGYYAIVVSGGAWAAYWYDDTGARTTIRASAWTGASTPNYVAIGDTNTIFGTGAQGQYRYLRMWNAALSDADLEAEFAATSAVRTSDLRGDWPLADSTDDSDSSGNGNTLTLSGTIGTSSEEPPIGQVETGTSGGLVVGSETSFVGEGFVGSIEAASGSYTLTAAQGSYSLAGQAAGLRANHILTAAQGSYSLNGQDATLRKSYPLVAAQGSYSLSGQDAALRASRVLSAAQGNYALNGQAANLLYGRTLAAAQGTYTLTGQDAGLRIARVVLAGQGSYSLSGQVTGLLVARRLAADQGLYSLTGYAAGLIYSGTNPTLIAGAGSYSLAGQGAALRRSALLAAGQGAYALNGQDAGLIAARRLTAAQGAYTLGGQDAGLFVARRLSAESGTYSLTGYAAGLVYSGSGPVLTAAAGTYTITGQAALLRADRVLSAATGIYTLDGQPANLLYSAPPAEPEAEPATGGWSTYFRREQEALRRRHLKALDEEAEEAREREALAERLEAALIADGTATQHDVDRLRLAQLAAQYADRALLDRRAQRALAYAERAESALAVQLALRELRRQQEDEELALLLALAAD